MRATSLLFLLSSLQLSVVTPVFAASLQATPITVEIRAPGAVGTVTLKNEDAAAVNTQIRVFRWSQVNGEEKLEPTTDFVASPPMTIIAANGEQIVRLVRTAKTPVQAEETYRILVDEIPDPNKRKAGQIGVALRYSIPIFVMPPTATESKVQWSMQLADGKAFVSAKNEGSRRVRLSGMKLKDQAGNTVSLGEGLNGYVLARSSMRWVIPSGAQKLGLNGPVSVTARGDDGPINAQARLNAAQ